MNQKILSFEEFCKNDSEGHPRYLGCMGLSGFYNWFLDDTPFIFNRRNPLYERFKQEHLEFESKISRVVTDETKRGFLESEKSFGDRMRTVEPLLYEAYQKMRALVESDEELGL